LQQPLERYRRLAMTAGVAWRLGPRPLGHLLLHRLGGGGRLRPPPEDALATPLSGPVLPGHRPAPAPGQLPAQHKAMLLMSAAGQRDQADWHGPFDPTVPSLALDLFAAGDIRPVWEVNRLAALPLLAQAHRLNPRGGHGARAAALLADWIRGNPAYRGPAWACGQETALRALHLMLALALLDGDRPLSQSARALLALHADRIAATPHYAAAQDNNHPVSEAAGLFACGLGLQSAALQARGARRLARCLARLVGRDGSFAQVSPQYHRLLLDVLAVAEWLRRRHGAPAFAPVVCDRAAAATLWLHRLAEPGSGATPRIGHVDDSAFADLSLGGPRDARGSLERAARLFRGESAGFAGDPGAAWLDLPLPAEAMPPPPPVWHSATLLGWSEGPARLVLRAGRLRFRPGHADLLHADLWTGGTNLLADGGTGAYNPPPDKAWLSELLAGTAGHNTIAFDGQEQMPRLSRFLHARWPRSGQLWLGPVPVGGWLRDWRGNRHERRIQPAGRAWMVEDRVSGRFSHLVLRWRLGGDRWHGTATGAEGPAATLEVEADAPLDARLVQGWESQAYGVVRSVPLLEVKISAPVSRITTVITIR
jgi:hypothetical protein